MNGKHRETDPAGKLDPLDPVDQVDHRPPPLERKPTRGWWICFLVSLSMLGLLGVSVAWLFWEGIGIWGLNNPVGWAFDITNFVFWVGIGHAGTLISAILYLLRQR